MLVLQDHSFLYINLSVVMNKWKYMTVTRGMLPGFILGLIHIYNISCIIFVAPVGIIQDVPSLPIAFAI